MGKSLIVVDLSIVQEFNFSFNREEPSDFIVNISFTPINELKVYTEFCDLALISKGSKVPLQIFKDCKVLSSGIQEDVFSITVICKNPFNKGIG